MTLGNATPRASIAGQWAAPGAMLVVDADGGRLEQDCGAGRFGPVKLDAKGRFQTSGHFETYGPGPQHADETPGGNASFSGRVEGQTLHLTIKLGDGAAQELVLTKGKRVKLIRCY